ncbi:RNA-directed DNA polymerase from transposon X-element, partial [Paramuricea clavata]
GFRNTKSQGILQVTDLNAAKKLPQHDFGNPDAHVTPSAVRLVTWQEENVDDIKIFLKKKTLVKDKDQSFVMLRPKKLVGSSGSVWASNLMGYINKDDIAAASRAPKESPFREYELSWLKWLLLLHQKCELDEELMSLIDSEQEIFSAIEMKTNKVITSLKELEKLIAESKMLDPVNLAKKYEAICSYRDSIIDHIDESNLSKMCHLERPDKQIRLHRAPGDSAQNEAERTNACIGDAMVDSGTLNWERYKPLDGMSAVDKNKLTVAKIEEEEKLCAKNNA